MTTKTCPVCGDDCRDWTRIATCPKCGKVQHVGTDHRYRDRCVKCSALFEEAMK